MIRRVGVVVFTVVALVGAGAGWWIARDLDPRWTAARQQAAQQAAAESAGREFLDEYVDGQGRVIRRDQGSDVVSEGQAYAMLIAASIGDPRFRTVWSWTKSHLLRPDGVLSWRWADGAVADPNSAADADLQAARALLIAGRRLGAADLTDDGKALAAGVLADDTAAVGRTAIPPPEDAALAAGWGVAGTGRLLTAGNWVTNAPYLMNPGYFSPRADADLLAASGDARWTELTQTQRIIGWQLVGSKQLPPDWAQVDAAGAAVPSGPAAGGDVQYGLDAARFPVLMAESCDPADRALAAAMRPLLQLVSDSPAVRHLDGSVAAQWQHPIAMVAAAAADKAAGDDGSALHRLDVAADISHRYPTYYGAAWVALGRIMLTTNLLGACRPGST